MLSSGSILIFGSTADAKRSPNPNVVFELGYAVAKVGWNRIVLLFNEAFGVFPKDLPFDFDRHRASKYSLNESSAPKKKSYGPLEDVLVTAISAIITENPRKPSEIKALSPEEVRRQRDIKNLRWLLASVHWPTVEQHIKDAPKLISGSVLHFYDGFEAVREAHLFHLFDPQLLARVDAIRKSWSQSVDFGTKYERTRGGDLSFFSVPPNQDWTAADRRAWKTIETSLGDLDAAVREFLHYLRQNYLEVDIDDLNQAAWEEYVQFRERFEKATTKPKRKRRAPKKISGK